MNKLYIVFTDFKEEVVDAIEWKFDQLNLYIKHLDQSESYINRGVVKRIRVYSNIALEVKDTLVA